ncbi:MAG: MOSC N-terminal beta barrel domain-containing protein, partial [Candidatus Competibacteraceae bacterium]|nr:MOSC N-terminal beta barrel domain-containing protein [Candidatus Competibacteraceae bacterium]
MSSLRISALYHYPVKSCAGIPLDRAQVTPYGLERDRHWMVVDGQGGFLSQRRLPKMALIRPEIVSGGLVLHAPDMEPCSVPAQGAALPLEVQIWGDQVTALDTGDHSARWLEDYLGVECRLAALGPDLHRPVDPHFDHWDSEVIFADGFPLLLISQSSLEDLNARLDRPLPMERFRPNIVVSGCRPYAEDDWKTVRLGEILVHPVKPCARCAITTVDQQRGEVAGKEPLRTLAGYRRG